MSDKKLQTKVTYTCHVSHVTCHVSCVMCHVSHVTCHMSHVKCNKSHFFFSDKLVKLVGGGSVINGAILSCLHMFQPQIIIVLPEWAILVREGRKEVGCSPVTYSLPSWPSGWSGSWPCEYWRCTCECPKYGFINP